MRRRSLFAGLVGLLASPKTVPAAPPRLATGGFVPGASYTICIGDVGWETPNVVRLRQEMRAIAAARLGDFEREFSRRRAVPVQADGATCPGAVAALRAIEMRAAPILPLGAARAAGEGLHPSAGRSIASLSKVPALHAGNNGGSTA